MSSDDKGSLPSAIIKIRLYAYLIKKVAKRFREVIREYANEPELSAFAYFGSGSTISPRAKVVGHHNIRIGNNTHILDYAVVQCGRWGKAKLSASRQFPDWLTIGDDCSIQPYAFISTCGGFIEIGNHCGINPFCVFYGYGGLKIGNDVAIANGCVLVPQNHNVLPGTGSVTGTGSTGKGITIHDNVWLGSKVIVLDGVEIGKGAVIGAGAVVTKNIPPGVIAAGVPAEVIRER